jgi:pilus assembly protein Flp/PilA
VFELNRKSADYKSAKQLLARFVRDEQGATTMEYGMIVAVICTIVIVGIGAIGETTRDDIFGAVVSALSDVLATHGDGGSS